MEYSPKCVIEVMLKKGVNRRREEGGELALSIAIDEKLIMWWNYCTRP